MKTEEHPKDTNLRLGQDWLADLSMFAVRGTTAPRLLAYEIFDTHGFAEDFKDPGAESLLKRATRQGSKPHGYVCRQFARPDKDTPLSFGIYRIDAVEGESGDEHSCVARVRLEQQYNPKTQKLFHVAMARPPGKNGGDPIEDENGMKWAENIAQRANELLNQVDASDLGLYLRNAAETLGCAKSIGGGNNYIVPPMVAEQWYEFLNELQIKIGIWHERVVLSNETTQNKRMTTEAATSSLDRDLQKLCEDLKKAIEKKSEIEKKKEKGERTGRGCDLGSRIKQGEQLRAKAKLFAEILGDKREELENLVDKLNVHFNALIDGGNVDPSEAELSWIEENDSDNDTEEW